MKRCLYPEGWGAVAGFPALVLDEAGPEVGGFLFSSTQLADLWPRVEDFEGEGYERRVVTARRGDGTQAVAFLYAIRTR